jgi:hypothetical protein
MPAPSVRSRIAGVGSILDFASKRKRPIAVFAATLVLMAGFAAASGEHKTALEDVGKVWACAKAPHPSHSGYIEAASEAKDEFSSCKKAVEMAEKKLAAKYHLSEKEAAKLLVLAEHDPQAEDLETLLREWVNRLPEP